MPGAQNPSGGDATNTKNRIELACGGARFSSGTFCTSEVWDVVASSRRPRPRLVPAMTCLVVLCLDIAMTLGLSALGSSLVSGDCKGKPPFTHPLSSRHAVLTAQVIFVGRSIQALTRGSEVGLRGFHDRGVGDCLRGGHAWRSSRTAIVRRPLYCIKLCSVGQSRCNRGCSSKYESVCLFG